MVVHYYHLKHAHARHRGLHTYTQQSRDHTRFALLFVANIIDNIIKYLKMDSIGDTLPFVDLLGRRRVQQRCIQ